MIPRGALGDRADADLAIVRSPQDHGAQIRKGDRLLVDTSEAARVPSPPADFLLWDGLSHRLEHLEAVSSEEVYNGRRVGPISDIDIVGRIVVIWRVS